MTGTQHTLMHDLIHVYWHWRLKWRYAKQRRKRIPIVRILTDIRIIPCLDGQPAWRLPELGSCNSSHGGSCCSCGGRLPLPHSHIAIQVLDQPEWRTGSTFGGNTCSWRCTLAFLQWATTARDENLCPGHGRPDR